MTEKPPLPNRYPDVEREAFYVPAAGSSVFVWQHATKMAQWRNEVVILCSPIGYEYTHSYRSLRHLADSFAQQGFVVLRFDFHGMGNSPGSELDAQRIAVWQSNVESITGFAQETFPGCKVCLAGLRFGATLACMASMKQPVDHLLLWEPVIRGKAYVRELMALARFSASAIDENNYIESAGFLMVKATAEDIKEINLLARSVNVNEGAMLIARDDRATDGALAQKMLVDGVGVEHISLPGFAEMMAEPQQTQVPFATIDKMIQWLVDANSGLHDWTRLPTVGMQRNLSFHYPDDKGLALEEQPCWYDEARQLFAVSSYPKNGSSNNLPAIILVNSGSVHHVGPNRIYCELARTFAALGYFVLRLDLEGLGDSRPADPERENHPYQKNAVVNIYQAMDYLVRRGVANHFVVGGICSGAHTAYHSALTAVACERQGLLKEILLINPLTFYWEEGMSLAIPSEVKNLHDTVYYRQSIRNLEKWKKLITGKASTGYILRYIIDRAGNVLRDRAKELKEMLFKQPSRLAKDLKRIQDYGIQIRFLLSSTDPGYDILKSQARRALRRGIARKSLALDLIAGADHTFSRKEKRDDLLRLIRIAYGSN